MNLSEMFHGHIPLMFQHVIWSVVSFSITKALIQQFYFDEILSVYLYSAFGFFYFSPALLKNH